MSFEGTAHHICANGHLWNEDALADLYRYNAYDDKKPVCPHCKAEIAWTHIEDQTNGYEPNDPMNNGEINNFLKSPPIMELVNVVSQKDGRVIRQGIEEVEPAKYNIPTTFGHKRN